MTVAGTYDGNLVFIDDRACENKRSTRARTYPMGDVPTSYEVPNTDDDLGAVDRLRSVQHIARHELLTAGTAG